MIHFCPHAEIDVDKWDNIIRKSRFSTVFATYDVLTGLTEGSRWDALIMNDYEYVMPLPARSKCGLHYVYPPFFVSQLGIFSDKETTATITFDFFKAIPDDYVQIDMLLNMENDSSAMNTCTTTLVSHELNLQAPYTELYARFSQNTKRNIKDARKHGVQLICGGDVNAIIDLFRQNRGKDKNVHFQKRDYRILKKTADLLQSAGRLEVMEVHTGEGKRIAGALFVRDYQRTWFWFSGRDNKYASCKPMFFLFDEYIKTHVEQPIVLDFNGSKNENVARLYKSFGGQPYTVKMLSYTRHTRWEPLIRLYRKIKNG